MIIQSLLDTDLYKFTMMQVVLHHFPGAQVEYRFKCRTEGVDFRPYLDEIRAEGLKSELLVFGRRLQLALHFDRVAAGAAQDVGVGIGTRAVGRALGSGEVVTEPSWSR